MRGSLKKRSPNTWTIILSLARDPATGKRRQQWMTVKGTRKVAEVKLAELLTQVDSGAFLKPSKLTVTDFLRRWLLDYVSVAVRPTTGSRYASIVNRHLIPQLGGIALAELQAQHLMTAYRTMLTSGRVGRPAGGPLTARTVLHIHRVFREALGHAVKWGFVARNVALAVDPPRPQRKEIQPPNAEQLRGILKAAEGTPYHAALHLAVFSGVRRSELLATRWRDLDFVTASLSIERGLHVLVGGVIAFMEPKSARSRRQIPLSPEAALALRLHRERREADAAFLGVELDPDGLIFAWADGRPLLPGTLSHAFTKIAAAAGLPNTRLHDLRHAFATLLLRSNVHPRVVQGMLGHATIGTTLDIYSYAGPDLQEAAAKRLEEALAEPTYAPEPPLR